MKTTIRYLIIAVFSLMTVITPATTSGQRNGGETPIQETFTGTIVGIGGALAGHAVPFTLTIKRTTSDQDVQRYVSVLSDKGQDGLMHEIKDQKLGTFSVTGQVGRDVNVARIHSDGTGRKITVLFERWLNLFELRYGTRSEDYPFTYAEIYMDDKGKGEGTLIPAARIRFEKDNQGVEIENFGIYPARLAEVREKDKYVK
jgi:hypothetical protein